MLEVAFSTEDEQGMHPHQLILESAASELQTLALPIPKWVTIDLLARLRWSNPNLLLHRLSCSNWNLKQNQGHFLRPKRQSRIRHKVRSSLYLSAERCSLDAYWYDQWERFSLLCVWLSIYELQKNDRRTFWEARTRSWLGAVLDGSTLCTCKSFGFVLELPWKWLFWVLLTEVYARIVVDLVVFWFVWCWISAIWCWSGSLGIVLPRETASMSSFWMFLGWSILASNLWWRIIY